MAKQKHHSKEAAAKQTAASKTAASVPATTHQEALAITTEQRHHMIDKAAYFIAEQRGFQGDMALNDWLQAEAAVDARSEARH